MRPSVKASLLCLALLAACSSRPPPSGSPPSDPPPSDPPPSDPAGAMTDADVDAALAVMDAVHARVEALLATAAQPTSEQLLAAVRAVAGVTAAGTAQAQGTAVWIQPGARRPYQLVVVEPPLASGAQRIPAAAGPALAALVEPEALGDDTGAKSFALLQNIESGEPGQREPDDSARRLVARKYQRVATYAPTLSALRSLGRLAVLYLNAHSGIPGGEGPGGLEIYSIETADSLPPRPEGTAAGAWRAADLKDFREYRLGVYTRCASGTCRDTFDINENFVREYFRWAPRSLFFLDACSSAAPAAEGFRSAAFSRQLSYFVGWDGPVTWPRGWAVAHLFFDRFLGTNEVTRVEVPRLQLHQRPFDPEAVLAELQGLQADSTTFEDGGIKASLQVLRAAGVTRFAGAPSTKTVDLDERKKELKLSGLFGLDPGAEHRTVTVGGAEVEVRSWNPDEIVCALPPGGEAGQTDVVVTADDHEGNRVQLTEWSLSFTMDGAFVLGDVGSSRGTYAFDVRFRADVHEYREHAGEAPIARSKVPFEIEDGGVLTWNGTTTILDQTTPFAGSTSNLYPIDYGDPAWMVTLPVDTNLLAGEGWVDVKERRLYLFLVGIGENSGAGTYNIGEGDCPVYIDGPTYRVFLTFPLGEDFGIADGSCSDRILDGDTGYSGTRSWSFRRVSPPDPEAAR